MSTKRYADDNISHYGQDMKTNQMSISGRMDELCYTHTMGYYTAKETNKLQLDATTWMTLILLKISQTENTYCMSPFIEFKNRAHSSMLLKKSGG